MNVSSIYGLLKSLGAVILTGGMKTVQTDIHTHL